MQIIGFSFTKIHAEKTEKQIPKNSNLNIEFKNIQSLDLNNNKQNASIDYHFSIGYSEEKQPKESPEPLIIVEGNLAISLSEEETKTLSNEIENNKLPKEAQIPLYNFLIRKLTPKILTLQEELGLPHHISFPQVTTQNKNKQS